MVNFFSLILFLVVSFFISSISFAEGSVPVRKNFNAIGKRFSDPTSAAIASENQSYPPSSSRKWEVTGTDCTEFPRTSCGYNVNVTVCNGACNGANVYSSRDEWRHSGVNFMWVCSDGSSPNSNAPFATACPAPLNQCKAGDIFDGWIPDGQSPANVCKGGCESTVTQASDGFKLKGTDGKPIIVGQWMTNGRACTAGEGNSVTESNPKASSPDPYYCASKGMGVGAVNGETVCVSPTKDNPLITTTTYGDKTTTITGADGTSSTTTTPGVTTLVTNDGRGETVTTTKTNIDGTKIETKEDKQSFCQENLDLSICKKTSFFGDCTSLPNCEGDAIQCAVAASTFQTNCAIKINSTAMSDLGSSIVAGNDPHQGTFPNVNNPTIVPIAPIDMSGYLSGKCLADTVINIGNGSITLPWSQYCSTLTAIGYATIAAAAIICLRIIGKA